MKKALSLFVLAFVLFSSSVAYADIFGGRAAEKAKASKTSSSEYRASAAFVDPGTILDYVAAIAGYLGTREGGFYDFDNEDFGNYLAATVYTIPDTGISFNIGLLNVDGVGATADWNVGSVIPSQDVPALSFLQYLYVGGGVGYRNVDNAGWDISPIIDAQFKFTF